MALRLSALLFVASAVMAQTVAITDCTVIDPRRETAAPHSTIVIQGERIAAVGPAATTRVPAGVRVLRGAGKFVIPGLWDMHVHVGAIEEDWFPLYLANGVTGLREMAASEQNAARQRRYQEEVAGRRRAGPELFRTLFAMNAPAVGDAREARAEVARRAAMGLTFIKVYNGLSREAYFATADECRRRGLQMVGHIPDAVSAREVARAGQASVEHLDGVLLACSREEAGVRWLARQKSVSWKMILDTFDRAKADALADSFREGGVWQTPTLTIHRVAALAQEDRLPGGAPVRYARRDYLAAWPREALDGVEGGLTPEVARRLFAAYQDMVRRMNGRGVRLLAGTDTPFAYCLPGFALHDELELLVEAGLSPAAALRAATSGPAEFLRVTRDYGSIEPGRVADTVLLDANPLLEIGNTRKIHAVVRRGRVFDRAALDAMLDGVRRAVGN